MTARSAPPRWMDPTSDIRTGTIVALLFFIGLIGWAAFARLDAAAHAAGQLVVSGQRQAVQHRDGGVVGRIMVHEGQHVRRGQTLIALAAPEVQAQERALASNTIRLLAQRARLLAEQTGQGRLTPPVEFASLSDEDRPLADQALRAQQIELSARRATVSAQRGALGQRAAQARTQSRGYTRQVEATAEQLRLVDSQLAALAPLAQRGFVAQTRVRELERLRAQLQGQEGQYDASIGGSRQSAQENVLQSLQAQQTYRERTAAELREVDTALGEVLPKLTAARDQLARTMIRAPATGSVVGLSVFTAGGVINAGQKLMDIVPDRAPLIVQARFSTDDADDLKLGQEAMVRFPSLHNRALADMKGRLTKLSADSFVDDHSGQAYYTGEIIVPPSELRLIGTGDHKATLRAGLPAEVLVPLRARTALEYALEPITSGFWSSFREH
ncbi:secretion protein HylD [Sphingomonas sp. Leaf339]|uniref:HlyD family type I secretion periplasmic adaptor subunit n=1 Tax=Sphingomonas sp. Leaf339 TaxID=1736343 RepID=UPI0006FEDFB5|nr:HlyD family type I secretion periplasmic adaptor subunit [Sphingomonas sp. Leaf339]KQU57213.1 secretion protein HylD [Sphingomonas sp. Leaf339]